MWITDKQPIYDDGDQQSRSVVLKMIWGYKIVIWHEVKPGQAWRHIPETWADSANGGSDENTHEYFRGRS